MQTIQDLRNDLEDEREEHEKTRELIRSQAEDVFEYAAKVKRDVETLNDQLGQAQAQDRERGGSSNESRLD